jgi:5-methyltetrahydrofolate--homocysteine methyltransferase
MDTVLESQSKTVVIGAGRPFCVIGERINPTGRKAFQAQLQSGDLSQIETDVEEQLAGGADMLDVNVGDPLADEVGLMDQAIRMIQELTDIPLCIDSSIIEALEAGLAAYQGKALVNSVTGEDERMDAILPLVAKHGAAVIGLANDDEIPMDPQRRLEIARKIVSRAGDYGIKPEDVVIDPLAMPVGAEPRAVNLFNETVRLIRDDLGVNMTCGASNTAFGLPDRPTLGATFLAIAESHGLTSAIMDARSRQCVDGVRAADFLLGHDEWGSNWIAVHRARKAAASA